MSVILQQVVKVLSVLGVPVKVLHYRPCASMCLICHVFFPVTELFSKLNRNNLILHKG